MKFDAFVLGRLLQFAIMLIGRRTRYLVSCHHIDVVFEHHIIELGHARTCRAIHKNAVRQVEHLDGFGKLLRRRRFAVGQLLFDIVRIQALRVENHTFRVGNAGQADHQTIAVFQLFGLRNEFFDQLAANRPHAHQK